MNNELKPYGEYKETGYDWLENVPNHWETMTMRSITEVSAERNGDRNDLELLSVYREYGVIKKSSRDDNHNVESQDLSNYKVVDKGYLVMNKMKMWQGSLGVSKYQGIVSPAYIVCKLIGEFNYNYIQYLLRSPKFKTIYNRISYGVRVGQWDMRYDDFKNIKLFIPPIEEQNQIVKYLDYQLFKINKFIKAKKKLIAVLKEQKQAVINEAVTKGINPNVKMKPSGIEWLGDIPEHWEVVQLKRIVETVKTGGTPKGADEKYFAEKGFNWYTPSDFTDDINLGNSTRQLSELGLENVNLFPANTILMIGIGGTMGKVSLSIKECSCNQQINAIVCKTTINTEYLVLYLRMMKKHIFETANYATLPILNQDDTKMLPVIKIDKEEQDKIVKHINNKTKVIDKSISEIEKEIALITEYKTRLISDVVTGKVDVRNIVIDEEIAEETEFEEEIAEEETEANEDGEE